MTYTRSMPSGRTWVAQASPGRFVLEECSRSGTIKVKPVTSTVMGSGIVQLTCAGSHANSSDYYCSGVAPGLPSGYSREVFDCTAAGWRPSR